MDGVENKNPNIGGHRRRLHHTHAISRYARCFELLIICVSSERSCLIENMVRLWFGRGLYFLFKMTIINRYASTVVSIFRGLGQSQFNPNSILIQSQFNPNSFNQSILIHSFIHSINQSISQSVNQSVCIVGAGTTPKVSQKCPKRTYQPTPFLSIISKYRHKKCP